MSQAPHSIPSVSVTYAGDGHTTRSNELDMRQMQERAYEKRGDRTMVCTHDTFRFAVDRFSIGAFDNRLIAVDEFHHVSASPDNRLGEQVRQFIDRDKSQLIAMTGSCFRGDAEAVFHPEDEARFEAVR